LENNHNHVNAPNTTWKSIENENGNNHNIAHAIGTETLVMYVPDLSYFLATGHKYTRMSLFLTNIKINFI
jgi:hypothetical protein